MRIKICGLKYQENIREIVALQPDFVGFIFYPKSKRFVGEGVTLPLLPKGIKKVGVFVNEDVNKIKEKIQRHQLDAIQLHGNESPEFCLKLNAKNIIVIKAFSIENEEDIQQINSYENTCNLALLDTKIKQFGGSGKSFNWSILNNYTSSLHFMLSGGLGLENVEEALQLKRDKLIGFDLNSKLEIEPGLKSVVTTAKIIQRIREHERNSTK